MPGKPSVALNASAARLNSLKLSHVGTKAPHLRVWACNNHRVTDVDAPTRRPWILAAFFILAGLIGWWAAFQLTVEKIHLLENPAAELGCDFSILVQCGANLSSWQGSVFGFPNPLLGLGGFAAPIAVGVALLAGARFDRWFWIAFHVGVTGALAFVIWLISQSIFALFTLCPWCMVVWSVTIPLWWSLTFRNLAEGVYGSAPRRFGTSMRSWVVPITIASYAIVAIIAQVRLDVIAYL